MKTSCFALAGAAIFAAGSAQAQLLDQPAPPQLRNADPAQSQPFAGSFRPFPRPYKIENETPISYDTIFDSYRTDPKLLAGVELSPNLALETGFVNLFSRGFHFVEYGRADERAGALGTKGFSSHFAGKLTVPVGERFSAYGKLGVAYSQRKASDGAGNSARDIDVGPYANVGARFKLNEKASVSGEFTRFGNTANKWGGETNATGVSTKLKVGF
jgi:opacity protein-like surface antigen